MNTPIETIDGLDIDSDDGPLKAPFPVFGGKSRVAAEVWRRLGTGTNAARNFVEPFCFSAAVTLRRPEVGQVETINDLNAFVANFWRAVCADPEAVAAHADWPVNEVDLHARHRWLVTSAEAQARLQAVRDDPDAYDARIAGWWAWGACCWIGSGWCEESRVTGNQTPRLSSVGGNGLQQQLPHKTGGIVSGPRERQPALGTSGGGGTGLARNVADTHRIQLADAFARGRGVNGNDAASTCDDRRAWITRWLLRLRDRMRPVRVCCGHWSRVCDSPSTMTRLGTTAVFLDPPYRVSIGGKTNRTKHIYANDRHQDVNALCDEVEEWCLRWGKDKDVRIALCGLEGEYPEVEKAGWEIFAWKASGGYGNQSGGKNDNAARERIWFSPHCVRSCEASGLFGGV
jgi:hypothetical protein